MAGPGWWSDAMARLRAIVKNARGNESSRAAEALAEAQRQHQARREALSKAEAERDDAMRRALDGEVDASTLDRHRAAVDQARSDLAHAEALVRVAREREQLVERNRDVRLRGERRDAFRVAAAELTAAINEIAVCDERKVGAVRRSVAAAQKMRQIAPLIGVNVDTFPALWTPGGLVNASSMDLVRLEPRYFRYFQESHANVTPSLVEQHRHAIVGILPPEPEPRPVAA